MSTKEIKEIVINLINKIDDNNILIKIYTVIKNLID